MLRINLLPSELLEKRKYEKWYGWVLFVAAGVVFVVLAVWLLFLLEGGQKASELQLLNEQTRSYASQAKAFEIFEQKEKELASRQAVAQTALSDRVNMGRLANEISLVLPDEVWVDGISVSQQSGLTLSGNTPRTNGQGSDVAYKSVARLLVRLAELKDLGDVWLSQADNGQFSRFAKSSSVPGGAADVVRFQLVAKVHGDAASTPPSSTVPAPPSDTVKR